MNRLTAAVGSALFFAVPPGVVAGLVPWRLTRWQARGSPGRASRAGDRRGAGPRPGRGGGHPARGSGGGRNRQQAFPRNRLPRRAPEPTGPYRVALVCTVREAYGGRHVNMSTGGTVRD